MIKSREKTGKAEKPAYSALVYQLLGHAMLSEQRGQDLDEYLEEAKQMIAKANPPLTPPYSPSEGRGNQ